MKRVVLASLAALSLAACATAPQSAGGTRTCSAAIAEQAATEVRAAEAAFQALALAEGPAEAFARFAADDAVMFNRGAPIEGTDAIRNLFANWPAGAKLEWMPIAARGAPCGDMAWSWGRSTYTSPAGEVFHGRYATVWKRNAEGEWRFDFDAELGGAE